MEHPLVLFDGECGLCNGTVNFILARDPAGVFRFAPLQSAVGHRVLSEKGLPTDKFDTLVLVAEEKAWARSDAALGIARRLGFPWSLLVVLQVVPRSVRDFFYDQVAKRRFRWFGRVEKCSTARKKWEERFLN